ncbi:MAG TPA: hypothetical protein VEL82_06480 [Thermoplasmata archaeon]|nr:hypothetical protein [Thermoplasmata archaeon]
MAEPHPNRALVIALVVITIVAGAAGAGYVYYRTHVGAPASALTVQEGDNVTVNYIGVFGSGAQVGRVFDTSLYSVATNNASWPKSLLFHPRGPLPTNFTPLGVYVGASTPSGGYTVGNLTFGSVVPGFWMGLLGLPGNRTHYVTVPPSLGYSYVNASCFVPRPISYTIPVVVSLTDSEFSAQVPNVSPESGIEFPDPTYGWTDLILSTNATSIVYENLPSLGMTTRPQGWPVLVTNISTSTISLTNQLSPSQAGLVAGHVSGAGVCGSTGFIVSQVSTATGTYTEDYNSEVAGQTLIFIVTVVDILPPS